MARRETRRPAARPLAAAAATHIDRLRRQAAAEAQAGRPRRALAACRALLTLQPDRPDIPAFAGTLALHAGDAEEAVALYRRALALRPDFVEVHYNLGNALGALERPAEAVAAYGKALALRPDFMPAQHHLGNALRALGRLAEAVEAYRRALALQQTAAGERDLGIALHELGRLDEAIAAFRRCLALPDHRADVLSNLANALMERGDRQGTIAACERILALEPGNIEAWALKALALNEQGDAGARVLLDFDRFVQIIDFTAPPPGYPSLDAFNAALAAHIEAHPTLKVPSKEHPTYHNDALELTGPLLGDAKAPMRAFETMIRGAIARYLDSVPRQPPHPFLQHFPKKWTLASWATRLNGQGNLDPHIHFTGYLGGVYYPLLPGIVARLDQGGAGWFELGRPPERFHCAAAPLLRRIQPKEGRLLLFPGYFFHSTVPFIANERRISVAFDLMPRD
ncbi:MAG TPA: tetratricopeptide repeat protein [Stellaceae bacterium]|nr:tetratricopeptide repeat protein [Stellaceae bacterium]